VVSSTSRVAPPRENARLDELNDEQVLFLADILPTAYEVGVLNGGVRPGDTVAIVGAGPIGLATIMTAKLYSSARIIAIDLADSRLAKALDFGADIVINNGSEDALARVMELTGVRGTTEGDTRPPRFASRREARRWRRKGGVT
jgi:alcohol dehydrogenase